MPTSTEVLLKREVRHVLVGQGYTVNRGSFSIPDMQKHNRDAKRLTHKLSRMERVKSSIDFINDFSPKSQNYMLNSIDIDVNKIKPSLIEARTGTEMGQLFRWWNLTWWSLPYEKAYGRQMRFVVWDDYHNAPIGLIGLQSPILSWKVRDDHLGIDRDKKDFWVNQSMSAQRLGALPPYNKFLGGKLVASIMASDEIRKAFHKKYKNSETLILQRKIPANLLFITTTGAYGKSSVYNRLGFNGEKICDFIGYSGGYGSFHIPNTLYEGFIDYLQEKGCNPKRSWGHGPSVKMRNIGMAMQLLGFKKGIHHGMQRAVYLFPFAKNLSSVIQQNKKPRWHKRSVASLADCWQERWAYKRESVPEKTHFEKAQFLLDLSKDLSKCRKMTNRRTKP